MQHLSLANRVLSLLLTLLLVLITLASATTQTPEIGAAGAEGLLASNAITIQGSYLLKLTTAIGAGFLAGFFI